MIFNFYKFIPLLFFTVYLAGCSHHPKTGENDHIWNKTWREYLGDPHRTHYSALKQINISNVSQLEVAWTYSSGAVGANETNPIVIGDTLYGLTATKQPFALNAATGKVYWSKKDMVEYPKVKVDPSRGLMRGLSYWRDEKDQRLLYTRAHWLYAIDATTGETIDSFGDRGRVSLTAGLPESAKQKLGSIHVSSPGTIYKNLIIMGSRGDNYKAAIQAFNVKTGRLGWVFHTHPRPGEYGYDTWPKDAYKNSKIGGANSWPGMSIDRKRGIVYVPTNSPSPNYYGAIRPGQNLFGTSILALNAETGKRIWSYQLVHHDIFDRDASSPPTLLTVEHDGKKVDAAVQATKQGYIFLFNRVTGEPLFPIVEKPAPQSHLPGEQSWPTQPYPTKPAPFVRETLRVSDINPYAENKEELTKIVRSSRQNGPFTPPSTQGTIVFPGNDGGGEWGGTAADPDGIIYINGSNAPWYQKMTPAVTKEQINKLNSGAKLYMAFCSSCHGANRKGQPKKGIPSLVNLKKHRSKEFATNMILDGGMRMPSFEDQIPKEKVKGIVAFLFGEKEQEEANMKKTEHKKSKSKASSVSSMKKNKLNIGYQGGPRRFVTKNGYPAVSPPWGVLNAINMNTGEYVWKVTLGTSPKLQAKYNIPKTGTPTYGGPIVTAGNLLFIAATTDSLFKAYDKRTGKLLWKTKLPATGFATPTTYKVNGRQYVVIVCGGEIELRMKEKITYVAFALPKNNNH